MYMNNNRLTTENPLVQQSSTTPSQYLNNTTLSQTDLQFQSLANLHNKFARYEKGNKINEHSKSATRRSKQFNDLSLIG